MTTTNALSTPPSADAKRPYVAPILVVHGDVQTLTQKSGPDIDNDGGSFTPPKGP